MRRLDELSAALWEAHLVTRANAHQRCAEIARGVAGTECYLATGQRVIPDDATAEYIAQQIEREEMEHGKKA